MREKSAQNAPPHPPDPLKPIFLVGGDVFSLTKAKKTITLYYMPNLRCTVPII